MKKHRLLLFLLLLTLLLSACSSRSQLPAETPAGSAEEPEAQETPAPADYSGRLRISELMIKNKAALAIDGAFPDWVELENCSAEPVTLEGWSLSDKGDKPLLPLGSGTLPAGGFLVLPLNGDAFALSEEETLSLLSPDGEVQDSALCAGGADRSLQRQEDGSFLVSPWISPGYENGADGYEQFCSRWAARGLVINEVMVSNREHPVSGGWLCDWVEIKNCGNSPVSLAGCSLTDDPEQPRLWVFEDRELSAGELLLLRCDDEQAPGADNTGFALDAERERLYLYGSDGSLLDSIFLHDIPLEGSMGRQADREGFLYFAEPSPGEANLGGLRRVSGTPLCLTAPGSYEGVSSLSVELSGPGEIHYTLDGSLPTAQAPVYTGPIPLEKTAILRAVSMEEDAAAGRPLSAGFFLNEGHSLPILSLVTDDPAAMTFNYNNCVREAELPGNLSLYEGNDCVFSQDCDVGLRGKTSLSLPKKNLGVRFRSRYGGMLHCDLFDSDVQDFSSLAIRAGQDYPYTVIRNELCQELCREGSDAALTQASRWCVLYLNGQYWGIYSLKEDLSRQFYASHMGVSKDSVEVNYMPAAADSPFFHLVEKAWAGELRTQEGYELLAREVDLDSLMDWYLFEGYCANTDTQGNARLYRSTENGSRWSFCYYDLDWSFGWDGGSFFGYYRGINHAGADIPPIISSLSANPDFRDRLLRRYAELTQGVLSNEHVVGLIDEYAALLAPEIPRDHALWGVSVEEWKAQIEGLRSYINDKDWAAYTTDQLCLAMDVSDEEALSYFGRPIRWRNF